MKNFTVVQMACEILEMQRLIEQQEYELQKLRKFERLHAEEVEASLAHGEKMMNNMLGLLITPGVVEACVAAKS